jgi:hypothetical protein
MAAARPLAPFVLPALLTMAGGALLIASLLEGPEPMALFGSALAFFSGLVAFALQLGVIGRRTGLVVGVLVVLVSAWLAWRQHSANRALDDAPPISVR